MPINHHEHVDCIEVNHVYDKKGDLMFSQVVLWKIEASDGKLHNWGWKIVKRWPEYPGKTNDDVWFVLHHNERGSITITSFCYRERSTQHDVEREDTKLFWGGNAPNLFLIEKEVRVEE